MKPLEKYYWRNSVSLPGGASGRKTRTRKRMETDEKPAAMPIINHNAYPGRSLAAHARALYV